MAAFLHGPVGGETISPCMLARMGVLRPIIFASLLATLQLSSIAAVRPYIGSAMARPGMLGGRVAVHVHALFL